MLENVTTTWLYFNEWFEVKNCLCKVLKNTENIFWLRLERLWRQNKSSAQIKLSSVEIEFVCKSG